MTTLTPFTITYTSVPQWYTITFSTTWPTVYINSTSFAIKNHPWNANWVDISENWKKASRRWTIRGALLLLLPV